MIAGIGDRDLWEIAVAAGILNFRPGEVFCHVGPRQILATAIMDEFCVYLDNTDARAVLTRSECSACTDWTR
jgi:hypothetical protein